ncbi:MAG: hypothetical protein M0R70_03045 [Nitrospirae bacterium]|nr:hypothetical protein [Nitrospirota bacterium]
MMINNVISFDCQLRMKCRLLFLAVFAISPIVDAYADSLCSSHAIFNDLNDEDSPVSMNDLKLNDARKAIQSLNRASRQNHDTRALLLCSPATDGPAGRITRPQLPAKDSCSFQRCSLASSGCSPPVI